MAIAYLGRRKTIKWLVSVNVFIVLWFLWNYSRSEPNHPIKNRVKYSGKRTESRVPWNEKYENQIAEDERGQIPGLGDLGQAVHLAENELEEAKKVIAKEAFNLILSNRITYTRRLVDSRHPECREKNYPKDLPSASVIIIFNNERWSTLIRTVYSVLNGSPAEYLKEVTLVDDNSDHEELLGKLDYYIATRFPPKVKLFRLETRSGLVRARLHGAEQSSGDVLVFLDAHCEVTEDWLRPLLARIKDERRAVVTPIIDVIDHETLGYANNGGNLAFGVGGFSWEGHFTWVEPLNEDGTVRGPSSEPTRSPTMAGGLFAIDRTYFWEIGSYDREMNIWGGENLEMSFRVWQCGGLLEAIPCSRVGHIFRPFPPYSYPNDKKDTHGTNTARLVRVWMDEYKRLFFGRRPELKHADIGDLSERVKLRKKLNCKSFKWYLTNIYKNKFIPDENVRAWGRVKNLAGTCLDNLQKPEESRQILGIYTCNEQLSPSQYFSLTLDDQLRREFTCVVLLGDEVYLDTCSLYSSQKWFWMPSGLLMHEPSGKCLEGRIYPENRPKAVLCDERSPYQLWSWDHVLGSD